MTENFSSENAEGGDDAKTKILMTCGIIRPIASMSDIYTEQHWSDVHDIVGSAVEAAGYNLRLVSDGGGGILVADIIQNLYNDPIVICDVSGRNPNVMFELGMRVSFEKPVIIIKDDETPFSFDITPIKHLTYRRDLRMPQMTLFQRELTQTIINTIKLNEDENYRHYLRQFGPIEVAKIDSRKVNFGSIVEGMESLRRSIKGIESKLETLPTISRLTEDPLKPFRHPLASNTISLIHEIKIETKSRLSYIVIGALQAAYPNLIIFSNSNAGDKDTIVIRIQAPISKPIKEIIDDIFTICRRLDPDALVFSNK